MALGSLRKSGVARSNREGILERLGTAYLLTFQRATFLDIVAKLGVVPTSLVSSPFEEISLE